MIKEVSFNSIDLIMQSNDRLQIRQLLYFLCNNQKNNSYIKKLYQYICNRYFKFIIYLFFKNKKYKLNT